MTTHSLSRALPVSLILMSALTACGDVDHPPPVGQGGEAAPPRPPIVSLGGRSGTSGSDTGTTAGTGDDGPGTSIGGTPTDSSFGGTSAFGGSAASFGGSAASFGGASSL